MAEKETEKRRYANRRRNKKLLYLKKQNKELAMRIRKFVKTQELDAERADLVDALTKSLDRCGNWALYGYDGNEITLMSFLACSNKLCNVCNWQRQKKIRRKYMRWFDENRSVCRLHRSGAEKLVSESQLRKYESKGWSLAGREEYDLFHLMLSVPHTKDGWRGNRFYFRDIVRAFNYMRKMDGWNDLVYGGQFGVETTKNDNGYHIHIHSLLMVKKQRCSRNELHRFILKAWNRLTVDETNDRGEFSDEEVSAICKGNRIVTPGFAKSLDPRGATIIHLETIYWLDASRKKHYVSGFDDGKFIYAVMETISYLFKPSIFACSDECYDIEAIVGLLPEVYKNRGLYSKFGCLFGEKALNVKDDSLIEDFEETADGELVDYETGELLQREYFITNPFNLYNGEDDRIMLRRGAKGIIELGVGSAGAAVERLYEVYKKRSAIL